MKEKTEKGLSVPLWIDDIKSYSDFQMTRLSYFAAEAENPISDWMLILGEVGIPVIISGLTAAICQPSSSKNYFETVDDIDELFDKIEGGSGLSIETPDIWLPNKFIGPDDRIPKRGDLYRIGAKLFTAALLFRTGRTTKQEFEHECNRIGEKPLYRAEETRVFAEWNKIQIEQARADYKVKESQGVFMEYHKEVKAKKKRR